ncbi:MAG: nuclear transport factor 2 family protein [Bacteroidetes bacterium]|nr:nuclear transport factor 2 family protein [Bacteroidota bacterium]
MKTLLISWLLVASGLWTIPSVEEEVIARDKELNQLISQHRVKDAALIYADDFVLTTSSGKAKSKQDMLADISSPEVVLEINETTQVKVRVIENTAVLTGILQQKGTYKGNAFDVKLYVTDTWVKVNTNWILLAGHATVINTK